MVPVLGGAEHPETPPMTRPAVVRSLILGCAGELDAVTFAGVVATARIRPSVCQYSAIMSWARDNHGARIAVDMGVEISMALRADESFSGMPTARSNRRTGRLPPRRDDLVGG